MTLVTIKEFIRIKLASTQSRRDAATLVSGSATSQLIVLAATPILSRLYTPGQFGVLALFVSLTTILSSVATGRYELAIVIPKDNKQAKAIFHVGLIINVLYSIILLIIVVAGNTKISELLNSREISFWLYFVPIVVFMTGLFNLLNFYSTRLGTFKELAQVLVTRSSFSSILQVVLGVFHPGTFGLMVGNVAGYFIGYAKLLHKINQRGSIFSKIDKNTILYVARKYSNFPKISTLNIFISQAQQNIINVVLPSIFSIGILGFYSLANRILGLPSNFVGDSIRQIFMRNTASARQNKGNAIREFDLTLKYLILFTLPVFIVLYLMVIPVFTFIFGREWKEAGVYAQILIPFIAMKFISSNLSTVITVFEKQLEGLVIHFALFLFVIAILGYTYFNNIEIKGFLTIYSSILSIVYMLLIFCYRDIAKGK